MTVMLVGVVLPALSGVMSWIGRRNPARLWAAEQSTRGRVSLPAVGASLFDGVAAGAVLAAIWVLVDWAALGITGFEPSISRELDAVDTGIGGVISQTLSASAFIVLAIALVAETFDRFRVNAVISTILIAIGMGFVAATDQEAFLPGVTLPAGMTVAAALLVTVYRERGFLAAWIAGVDRGSAH